MRLPPAFIGGLAIAVATAAGAGVAPPDCDVEPEAVRVVGAIFAGDFGCDLNDDGVIGAADLSRAVALETLPACPPVGASLEIAVDNLSGDEEMMADLRGDLVEPSCRSSDLGRSYRVNGCSPGDDSGCATLAGLIPGVWRHRITSGSGAGLQLQYRRSLLTADTAGASLRFKIFASVLLVSSTANSGDNSLRIALQAAPLQPKPLLIRFHDVVFPAGVPTTIALDFPLTTLATDDVTIDGTDALGQAGNRVIDAQGLAFGVLAVTGARNHIIGLRLRNAGGSNRDIVGISGAGAVANVLERCVIETSADGDGVGVDDKAGIDFGSANIVRECEISGADDKGIKVTTGAHARVERSWIHHNVNGGVQATLGGNLEAAENLIEDNAGGTAQNGMSSQGFDPAAGASRLFSNGDVVRRNGANGAAVRGFALGRFTDSYFAANRSSGLRVFNDVGSAALASAAGTTFACNAVDGAVVSETSRLDLGGGELASAGGNAMTQNNLPAGGANLRNATENIVEAVNNQWEHCGLATTCSEAAIAARDLSDGGLRTDISPAQAHRALEPPVVTRVAPAKGRAGELLRIYGSRFNAIDGHFDQSSCEDVIGRNRCVPLRGNCVRIGGISAPVEAVTPRMLVVRWPFTCVQPVPLVVTIDQGSTGISSQPFTVCTDVVAPAAAGD